MSTTICDEIRSTGTPVFIDDVDEAPLWKLHPTPVLYGFKSYVSIPVIRPDGSFFGTLCAIDPVPHIVSTEAVKAELTALASAVAAQLEYNSLSDSYADERAEVDKQ